MGICKFKTADVKRCVAHALRSSAWGMAWSAEPPQPALFFVHDQGVYLMSNGQPIDKKNPAASKSASYVVYAEGCDPNSGASFDEWYGHSRDLVGGDDFVETLPVDKTWLESCDKFKELVIEVSRLSFDIRFERPKKTTARAGA
jgi:hypothetical protein